MTNPHGPPLRQHPALAHQGLDAAASGAHVHPEAVPVQLFQHQPGTAKACSAAATANWV
ncbi:MULTISPECIES: hypothetical protein [Paenibacillus]|uniref:hypothetical protein n=1 Tax=Paenibacillus TaxID=44249 RepID=UPI0022B91BB7|nr:hypothetical protein [Paenibacillus caseinilyticus]MCZ8521043.1 hypothetical protein [Paenibacillus caseinilyticus]